MKISTLRKKLKEQEKKTAAYIPDTSMTAAVDEVLFFAKKKGY